MGRGSRGSRPRTPRTGIPTSYTKGGARPSAPGLPQTDAGPPPVPSSNDRAELGSVVTLRYVGGPGERVIQLVDRRTSARADGVQVTPHSPVGRQVLGRPAGEPVRVGTRDAYIHAYIHSISGAPGQRPSVSDGPTRPDDERDRSGHSATTEPPRVHPAPHPRPAPTPEPAPHADEHGRDEHRLVGQRLRDRYQAAVVRFRRRHDHRID